MLLLFFVVVFSNITPFCSIGVIQCLLILSFIWYLYFSSFGTRNKRAAAFKMKIKISSFKYIVSQNLIMLFDPFILEYICAQVLL